MHSCFPSSSPGFESQLRCDFFSLLFSLWAVLRSNPSRAKQRISQMQLAAMSTSCYSWVWNPRHSEFHLVGDPLEERSIEWATSTATAKLPNGLFLEITRSYTTIILDWLKTNFYMTQLLLTRFAQQSVGSTGLSFEGSAQNRRFNFLYRVSKNSLLGCIH